MRKRITLGSLIETGQGDICIATMGRTTNSADIFLRSTECVVVLPRRSLRFITAAERNPHSFRCG